MVHDLDVKVLTFSHFGKNVPKQHKLSPDAFVQMTLQLAYFRWEVLVFSNKLCFGWTISVLNHFSYMLFLNSRMYNTCCSTYESASLRMFKYGRTEAIRSTTVDSFKFVQAMQDPAKQVLTKPYRFIVNTQIRLFKLFDWWPNPVGRMQRGWRCCRKPFRHIRKTHTMWEHLFSEYIWLLSVLYI